MPIHDLVIRGGCVVTGNQSVLADVAINDGVVEGIGDYSNDDARESISARGLHVLPGVIDSQVHMREPGGEHKEDLETGTLAAVLGGVTAVCEMPNTSPPTTTRDALNDKLYRAGGRASCDYAFFVGAARDNIEALGELERLEGCSGVKIFMGSSTGDLLVAEDDDVRRVLEATRRRVAVHCEDQNRLEERKRVRVRGRPHSHPVWRDEETALRATRRLVRLLGETRRRAHVLHVTTAEEMDFLADKKELTTVECTPQHLTLAAPECYDRLGTYAQMNPPIRGKRHREALWKAVERGVVDVIGSDHAPHTREEKDAGYPDTPSGMPGVQTLLPIMLDHVNAGRLSLQRLVQLTSEGPSRVYGMSKKGRLEPGWHADLVMVDLEAKRTIRNDWIATRAGWTPFDGVRVTGWPVATIIRGRVVMRDGEILEGRRGRPIRFD